MRKKLTLVIDAVVVLALIGAGIWWYGTSQKTGGRTVNIVKTPTTQETVSAEKTPEPLKEEFVVPATIAAATYGDEKVTTDEPAKLPEAVKFQSFSYDPAQGKVIAISGGCTDAYYAVLVFDAKTDYRKDPAAARVNRASECPADKLFRTQFDFRDFNLPAGSYYFFVADQGNKGSWYNPR
ncbi:hypothetical protein HY839_00975 [Candidatus Azambacteria bacterium]|nr:hypothetical protein [Candidatus Azambacteria bacterium]